MPEILLLAENVIRHTTTERPFLIIDTSNATLEIDNENDNSEVGRVGGRGARAGGVLARCAGH